MLGAIIGDVVGSVYEWNNIKTKDFELFKPNCFFTDDTVMTVAVANALLETREKQSKSRIKKRERGALTYEYKKISFKEELIQQMQDFGRRYPNRGYGGMFAGWLVSDNPQPYNSFGNGSAMRVSPCGYIAVELDEALALAKASAEVTHNHPEGIKGAQAVAAAIFLARCYKTKDEIKQYIEENFILLTERLMKSDRIILLTKLVRKPCRRQFRLFWSQLILRMQSEMQFLSAETAIHLLPSQAVLLGHITDSSVCLLARICKIFRKKYIHIFHRNLLIYMNKQMKCVVTGRAFMTESADVHRFIRN